MINIFEVFLPQLLRYPNPTDPLNGEAAALMMREPKGYEAKVKGELLLGPCDGDVHFADATQSTSPNTPPRRTSTMPATIPTIATR
jgi:hypothetical protein